MAEHRRPRKSATAKFNVWVDAKGHIKLASTEAGVISWVSNEPGARYHRNLYGKLRKFLKREGCWRDEL